MVTVTVYLKSGGKIDLVCDVNTYEAILCLLEKDLKYPLWFDNGMVMPDQIAAWSVTEDEQ